MTYTPNFTELLSTLQNDQYIGLGNPNAKILFIGKEAGLEKEKINYHGSLQSWEDHKYDYSARYIPPKEDKKIRNLNHTWQRYQKLYDCILSKINCEDLIEKRDKYEISFVENIFTTELSNLHDHNTKEAKKQTNFSQELEKRKEIFFNTKFIESFPITVIFASDNKYIETYPGEVCKLFKVKFDTLYNYSGKDKIWIHSSFESSNPKLLIHTRQLTNRISADLIDSLSTIISNFIKEHTVNIKIK